MSRPRLASRLMQGQLVIVAIGVASWVLIAWAVAPRVFTAHLSMAGDVTPAVAEHAQEAFDVSLATGMLTAGLASVIAAAVLSWLLARRVSGPVGAIAESARLVAAGQYDVVIPELQFSRETAALAAAFRQMAAELEGTEAARARVMSDLAHEIRTPLATLEAQIDGIEDGVVSASPETLEAMRGQVERLRRLAADLRRTGAVQEGRLALEPQVIAVGELVRTAIADAQARFAGHRVALHLGGTPGREIFVSVDVSRMQQVLGNLLENARRYSPEGGDVTVTWRDLGDAVEILVCDQGIGIAADELPLIFERFHRADRSRAHGVGEGSGLGLNIARAIVNASGGTLTASSPGLGHGSTLAVRLPIAPEDSSNLH